MLWDLKKCLGISIFLDKVVDIVYILDIVDNVDIIESWAPNGVDKDVGKL